jgi:peptidoglycan/xylan/chitin deacetylase (PgdA/CDA1 family)
VAKRRRLLISLAAYLAIVVALPVALASNDRPGRGAHARAARAGRRGDAIAAPTPVQRRPRQRRPRRHTGCTSGSRPRRHGAEGRKLISLTFDDGPSAYTGQVLRILRRFGATATFFDVGQVIPGREAVMRRIVRSGSEIGNHSMHHDADPPHRDLAAASRRIRHASGFAPCLFRPPYGVIDRRLVRRARKLGLETVRWSVDPDDWERPGATKIYRRVVEHVHPGAIVMLHDGGGDRGQTVAALPRILGDLHRRGYRSVAVTRLLRHRWRSG